MHCWHIHQQRCERSRAATRLTHDPAAVIAHSHISILRRSRDAETVFHTTHHRDVSMPASVHNKVPRRNQHKPGARLPIESGRRGEIHILTDGHAPSLLLTLQYRQRRRRLQVRLEGWQDVVLVVSLHNDARFVVLHRSNPFRQPCLRASPQVSPVSRLPVLF